MDIINNPSVKADLPLNFAKRLVAVITKQEIENMNANKVKQPVVQKEIVKQEPITTIQEVVVNVVEEGKQEVSEEETYIKELKEEKIKQDTLKKLTKEAKKQKEKAKKDKE